MAWIFHVQALLEKFLRNVGFRDNPCVNAFIYRTVTLCKLWILPFQVIQRSVELSVHFPWRSMKLSSTLMSHKYYVCASSQLFRVRLLHVLLPKQIYFWYCKHQVVKVLDSRFCGLGVQILFNTHYVCHRVGSLSQGS